ncbi:MAG TPA: hypothetical protein V6D20_14860, partial [Candidatus Obscuribacterales bacterium]
MVKKQHWGFNPDWLEYVKQTWKGNGRVEQIKEETPESLAFKDRAAQAFTERGIPFKKIKTWISIQVPVEGKGYDVDYPHV